MNYIRQLQSDTADRDAQLTAAREQVWDFLAHLSGPKFQGFDDDGARRDWIATADVRARLRELLSTLL